MLTSLAAAFSSTRGPHLPQKVFILGTAILLVLSSFASCENAAVENDTNGGLSVPSSGKKTIFLGIFTIDQHIEHRTMIRAIYSKMMSKDVEFKFIMGRRDPIYMDWIDDEVKQFDDIIFLDVKEAINEGKSYAFFKYAASNLRDQYDFICKVDDDSYIIFPRFMDAVRRLPKKGTYYGRCKHKNGVAYMLGMAYVVSYDVVEWIAQSPFAAMNIGGDEDVDTGRWLQDCPLVTNWITENHRKWHFVQHWEPWIHARRPKDLRKIVAPMRPDAIVVHNLKTSFHYLTVHKHFVDAQPLPDLQMVRLCRYENPNEMEACHEQPPFPLLS